MHHASLSQMINSVDQSPHVVFDLRQIKLVQVSEMRLRLLILEYQGDLPLLPVTLY